MINTKNCFTKTLLIILAILLIGGGVYLFLKNDKTPVPQVQDNFKPYSNQEYGFSVKYPKDFVLSEGKTSFFNELDIFGISIKAPADYEKDTDFNVGNITLSVSSSTAKCYISNSVAGVLSAEKNIGGKTFYYNPLQPFSDAALGGQRGEESRFASVINGQCYRITKLIGYSDLRGFTDPPYAPHFDEAKVNAEFDSIISSFDFEE